MFLLGRCSLFLMVGLHRAWWGDRCAASAGSRGLCAYPVRLSLIVGRKTRDATAIPPARGVAGVHPPALPTVEICAGGSCRHPRRSFAHLPGGALGLPVGPPPYTAVTPQCWCVWGPVGEPGSPAGWAPRILGRPPSRCRGQAVAPRLPSPACQRGKVVSRRVWACRRACVRDYIF